jgi:hypothetical protein
MRLGAVEGRGPAKVDFLHADGCVGERFVRAVASSPGFLNLKGDRCIGALDCTPLAGKSTLNRLERGGSELTR